MTTSSSFGDGGDLEQLKATLARYRTSLVDLSGRNRLLNFRHTTTTLELSHPGADALVAGLGRGWDFARLPDEELPGGDEGGDEGGERPVVLAKDDAERGIRTQKRTTPALQRALLSLRRRSTQLFNDYGLWTLQLGVGMLHWREDGALTGSEAPLILLPAELERTEDGRIRLTANTDEEPRLNPALKVKLEQFHIDWSSVAEQEPTDLRAVFAEAAKAVAGKSGWQLSERVVLAQFASHKEAMYQDLLENESHLLASDLVRAVALGRNAGLASDRFDFEEVEIDRIDELSPPEDSPLVLDADASQRQAVAAAVAGRSFVLDGPPGTGKSQTITNMIAGLMHSGRSVLFVSEKAAALDVVLDRLRSVGLDSYALPLHSHKTSRRAVAQELGRALAEEPRAPQLSVDVIAQARESREALSRYATAMNEVREPFGQSLHDVIGRVGRLHDAPVAYLTTNQPPATNQPSPATNQPPAQRLTAAATPAGDGTGPLQTFRAQELGGRDLQQIVAATEVLSAAWEAVADPTFPWRFLRAGVPHPRPVLEQAIAALDGLAAAVDRYRDLAPEGAPVDDEEGVYRLVALLDLLASRSPVPEEWLTSEEFDASVSGPVDSFAADLRRLNRARATARSAAGATWEDLPVRQSAARAGEAERALAALSPPGLDPAGLTEGRAAELAGEFDAAADTLERTHEDLVSVARTAGLDVPSSVAAAVDVCDVIALSEREHRPTARWLTPEGPAEADQAAVRVLADALQAFFDRRDRVLAAQELATAQAGPGWAELGAELTALPPADEAALAGLAPAGLDVATLTRRQIDHLAEWFAALVASLETADRSAGAVAALLGCAAPGTTSEAADLAALVDLGTAADRALETWFDPRVLVDVRAAVTAIEAAERKLAQAAQAGRETFLPALLSAPDLPDVVRRLTEGPQGIGGLLSSGIRADRNLIGRLTVQGSWKKDLGGKLPLALAWYTAHDELRSLTRSHAGLLGRYAAADLADVPALADALAHAERIHRLAPGATADPHARTLLAGRLADGHMHTPELLAQGAALRTELAVWEKDLSRPRLSAHAAELTGRPPGRAADWLRAHLTPFRQAGALLETVAAVGRRTDDAAEDLTVGAARAAVRAAHAAQAETAGFLARESEDRLLLGPWYRGTGTEAAQLSEDQPGDVTGFEATGGLLRRALDLTRRQSGPHANEEQRLLLGRFAADGRPDADALRRALEVAHALARLAPGTLADPVRRARLDEVLADGSPVPQELPRRAARIRAELDRWTLRAARPHLTGPGPALVAGPLDAAARWFRAHVEPFEDAAELIRAVSRVVDRIAEPTLDQAREAVAAVAAARAAEARFDEDAPAHRKLLGDLYRGAASDRTEVLDAVDWAQRVRRTVHGTRSAPLHGPAVRVMLTAPADPSVERCHGDWIRQREALAGVFEPRREKVLRAELAASLTGAKALLSRLDDDPYGPSAWTDRADSLTLLGGYGLEGLPAQLAQREVSAADFPAAVERAVLTAWVEHQLDTDTRLMPHRAAERDQLVDRFRAADKGLVETAYAEVIAACNARRPRRASLGAAGLIQSEAQKQRRHMPVRVLLREAREVVRLIKPCFMMSPLTVSQYLPPDFRFDVVIFDEASQVLPEDAVNSVYRGDQLIVAGDQKQLPPTSFFSATGDGDDDDEWDEAGTDGFESVLDACKASGLLRGLPLRWHYRSRHENLIAFSNSEFYDGGMVTFPGALEQSPDVGVEFFKADGVYDRGGRSNNPGEAAAVAARVIHHFDTRPRQSLGVVALSKAQADAIEDAVQRARAERPDLDPHFTEGRLDGFFVKNLESVQGDERDVVILSVGYGPDQQGKLTSAFGPINKDGGWRRLNVAVTRARRRMEVVASFHGGDLPEPSNRSVRDLKRYLEYAQHGPQVLQTKAADPEAEPESPFEEEVLAVLRDWGHTVQPQVGVAGFRIDMAVRHPAAPGSYALGIECDGVMYHSSRAARDRDRLREGVLRDLGWQLHRIWGTDWYRNRRAAMEQLRAAVEQACAADPHAVRPPVREVAAPPAQDAPREGSTRPAVPQPAAPVVEFARVESRPPEWSRPYRVADQTQLVNARYDGAKRRRLDGITLQDPEALPVVADVAFTVIALEGPIEEEMIFTRVRSVWNVGSSGPVVKDRIRRALRDLTRRGRASCVGTAYDVPGRVVETARTPVPRCDRKVAQVPAVERQLVLRNVIAEGPGAGREELLREVARFFGWARLGPDIRAALTGDIDELVARGAVLETGGGLISAGEAR